MPDNTNLDSPDFIGGMTTFGTSIIGMKGERIMRVPRCRDSLYNTPLQPVLVEKNEDFSWLERGQG